jgi:hypothetical protein
MSRSLELRVASGVLNAVPSVHCSFPFAQRVNELCGDPATRPAAIAVELPPATAAAVRAWMVQLGVGSGVAAALPALLGLVDSR